MQQNNPAPTYKRQLKNFLLLDSFQLKYTAVIVLISSLLCVGLGGMIYSRTRDVYQQSQETYQQTQNALRSAQDATKEARAASEIMRLENLSNPDAAKKSIESEDAKYAQKVKDLEDRVEEVKRKAAATEEEARQSLMYVIGLLVFLVVAMGVLGIVITHRVAGPIFVMGKIFQAIAKGDYRVQKRSLRKGDELMELFQQALDAVDALHLRSQHERQAAQDVSELLSKESPAAEDLAKARELLAETAKRHTSTLG